MAVQIYWVWIVLSFSVILVLEPRRTHCQITEGPSIISPSCNEEVLISVKNTTSGIEVNVANKHDKGVLESREFSHHLSSQCGEYNVRCKDLLVESSTSPNKSIVFVPLLDGIFLLEVAHRGKITDSTKLTINAPVPCSPTAISKIQENIIAVCLNEERGYLTTMQIYLNTTSISSSRGSRPQIPDFNFGHSNSPHLSDFKYIQDLQWILFASSNHVYTLLPLTYTSLEFSDDLGNCSRPESIVYTSDGVLIAYCHDFASYYSVAYEHAFNQSQYSKHGQPFLCPNPDVHVAVFASASYILYRVWSANSRETINIHDMKFDSGVCFGSRTRTLFAYNDKERGVYVLDPATSNLTHLSSKACLNSHCEPLLVFQNRYIVIRERENNDGNVIVVDSQQNYTTVIAAEHVQADFLTLLIEQDASFCSLTNSSLSTSTPTILPPSGPGTQIAGPAAGVSAGLVLILVLVLVVCSVVVFIVRKRRQKKGSRPSTPTQETSGVESQSSELQSDSESNGQQQGEAESPVGDDHDKSVTCTPCDDPHGKPKFKGMPQPNQVFESTTNEQPTGNATDQQNSSQSSGTIHNSPKTCGSATNSCRGASNKPNQQINRDAFPPSADSDLFERGGEEGWLSQPKSEESKDHEYDESCDEHIPGRYKTVPPRKSPRRKKRHKRAVGGSYEQL